MGSIFSALNSQEREDGSFDPSRFSQKMSTSKTTNYVAQNYETKYTGSKPILVVCTDVGLMKMANDKTFNTGNHPVETLLPMLHFRDAGFSFEIATPTGKPVVFEMWAYPDEDENVKSLYDSLETQIKEPKKLSDISSTDGYSAIFIPGGHGAMLSLPTDENLGRILREAHDKKLPTVTLCHGPAALLSTKTGEGNEFSYKGYKGVCFTDTTDKMTPSIGYLPGHMPWKCQKSLVEEGLAITNYTETGSTYEDRELITGDSPYAAHPLGVFAAPILVKHATEQEGGN